MFPSPLCCLLDLYIVGALTDGAIFEEGSNANGHWIKYANGRMEC